MNNNNIIIIKKAYTDIENQKMVTSGRRLNISILLPKVMDIPPLSEQQKAEAEEALYINTNKKKVALICSETGWSEEEFYSRADTFFQSFEELAAVDNDVVVGGVVDYTKLVQALTSANKKFFSSAGDVLFMIEIMLRTGKIVEVGFHKYKKNR
jgi:hypothetical protein